MNRHWNKTILPLLKKIKAKHIVEIGSDKGRNTRDILKYCEKNNVKLTSIDPKPNFDVNKLKEEYGDKFEFYRDLSLNVLPFLENVDAVLIDGDHNWYTVFNELKAIEGSYTNHYPLVLFHDVYWPYGRRDLYYNPETIPQEHVLPYEEKGIIPNQSELSPDKGINNGGFKNALYEGGEHNGVLTAIEDYINESKLDLVFYSIPAYYGLGILFLKNKKLQNIVENTIDYHGIMEELEKYYLTIIHSKLRGETNKLNQKINKANLDLKKVTEEKSQLQEINTKKDNQIKTLNNEVSKIKAARNEDMKTAEATITGKDKQIKILNEEITKVKAAGEKEVKIVKAGVIEKDKQIKILLDENNLMKRTIYEKNNQIEILEEKIRVMDSIINEKEQTIESFMKR